MAAVTVSDKGQVVIPAEIRKQLGITPGCRLGFHIEGHSIRVVVERNIMPSRLEDGYGMLVCHASGTRRLSSFDVAHAMREAADDRG
jgi:AbrB family looped-hinge helix DNA binding protein